MLPQFLGYEPDYSTHLQRNKIRRARGRSREGPAEEIVINGNLVSNRIYVGKLPMTRGCHRNASERRAR